MESPLRSTRRAVAVVSGLAVGAALALTATPQAIAAPSATAGASSSTQGVALNARSAAKIDYTSMYASAKVKSSKGKKLTVSVGASKSTQASFYIGLSVSGESHTWSFPAAKSSVKISSSGAGSAKLSAKKTGGLGMLSLKMKPAGKFKSYKCGGKVYSKSRNVKVTGKLYFNTKTKWGAVGSKRKAFKFNLSRRVTVSYDVSCPPTEYPDPCTTSVSWNGSVSKPKSYMSISGGKTGKNSSVYAYRSVQLKPKGAIRSDSVTKRVAAPVLSVKADKNATIKVRGTTTGTGTGKSAHEGYDYTDDCDTGTQHRMSWSGSFTNAKKPLVVSAQVFGSFKLPNSAYFYFARTWRTN